VIILATACCLVAVLASVSRAQDRPQLNGQWIFNPNQSDDAKEKVREKSVATSQRLGANPPGGGTHPSSNPGGGGSMGRAGGGGMGGSGMGGGMGGGRGMGPGGTTTPILDVSDEVWSQLAINPGSLRFVQHADQIVISDDSDHSQTFYPDGKKHQEKDANGKKISTKAKWRGDSLVTERKLGESGELTETYRVISDGKQLEVILRFEDPALSEPLSIRRVYDLAAQTQ
jgi:hypothetical protein